MTRTVPLLDLKAQFATIREEVLAAVTGVLESQVCINGPLVEELERAIAARSGCRFGVGVSSGTDALLDTLMALGVGAGCEVITTPFTFFATAGCIHRAGARAVFVDIEPDTYLIDPSRIEAAITERTRAILPVHLYGQPCDMDAIGAIARRHGLFVVEDAAQSIGATRGGVPCGGFAESTACCFSFFPSKNLGAAGDGGMIVTNDAALHDRMKLLRNHGAHEKYFHDEVGANFRLDALQAAVLLAKLPKLDEWSRRRRENAAYYDSRFQGTAVVPPTIRDGCVSAVNQYVVRVPNRDGVKAKLAARGVASEIYYPRPLHLQRCFEYLGYREGDLPHAGRAAREVLALPVFPELAPQDLEYVADAVLACAG